MTDRDEVIKDGEHAIAMLGEVEEPTPWCDFIRVSFETALALLREQEPVIVRCKNCRHYDTECCADGYGWCYNRDFGTTDEWYCADGEVK